MEFASLPILIIGGTAAILIPVLIHLFNRTRFQVTDWAAMEFLLAALKKTRRRVRLENLLLLFLRILILLFLALMLARPSVEGSVPLAKKTHYVLIIDDSWSMKARPGTDSSFERAKQLISQWINEDAVGAGNAISLIPTSARLSDFRLASLDSRKGLTNTGVGPAAEGDLAARLEQVRQQLSEARDQLAGVQSSLEATGPGLPKDEQQLALAEELKGRIADLQTKLDELQAEQVEQAAAAGNGNTGGNAANPANTPGGSASTAGAFATGAGADQSELYTTSRQWINERLDSMEVTLRPNHDWLEPLAIARAALHESGDRFEAKRVFLFTDMQRINLPASDSANLGSWRDLLGDIAKETSEGVRFVYVGEHAVNRSIVNAELSDKVVGSKVRLTIALTLRNNSVGISDDAQNAFRVRYRVDGGIYKSLPLGTTSSGSSGDDQAGVSIAPGKELTVSALMEPFTRKGVHTIELSLDDDAIDEDNHWYLTVEVRDRVSILVVDGAPGADGMSSRDEVFYFVMAARAVNLVGPDSEGYVAKTPVQVTSTTTEGIDGVNFFDYDVVLLANVTKLSKERVLALEHYVKAGHSVIFTLGDHIDEEKYNSELWRQGEGIFPMRLRSRTDTSGPVREIRPDGMKMLAVEPWHRSIRSLAEQVDDHLLDRPTIYQFYDFDWTTRRPGLRRVVDLAAYKSAGPADDGGDGGDSGGSGGSGDNGGGDSAGPDRNGTDTSHDFSEIPALLLLQQYGRGNVMVFTSALDGRWDRPGPTDANRAPALANTMPSQPSFVPFWQNMVYALAESSTEYRCLHVGDTFQRPRSTTEVALNNFVFPPGVSPDDLRNGRPVSVRERVRGEREDTTRDVLYYTNTDKPGVYTLKIIKRRDHLEGMVRNALDDEPALPPQSRRAAVQSLTDTLLQAGEGDTTIASRTEALRVRLRELFIGLDPDLVTRLTTRIAIESEQMFAQNSDKKTIVDKFVVNIDADEGQLEPIGTTRDAILAELNRVFPGVSLTVDARRPGDPGTGSGSSVLVKRESRIWKFIAFALLVLLGLEMIVALLFTSRQR